MRTSIEAYLAGPRCSAAFDSPTISIVGAASRPEGPARRVADMMREAGEPARRVAAALNRLSDRAHGRKA